ncbi:MAG TPA: hypothetical protein VIV65_00220, partial [Gemmatimonadaceae bacterium]
MHKAPSPSGCREADRRGAQHGAAIWKDALRIRGVLAPTPAASPVPPFGSGADDMCGVVGIFLGAHAADPGRIAAIRAMAAT